MRRAAIALVGLLAGAAFAQDNAATYSALLTTAIEQGRAGKMTEAVATFERALAAAADDDQRAQALLLLATAYRNADDEVAALTALERALALQEPTPWVVRCLQELTTLAGRRDRPELVRQAAERTVALLGPEAPEAAVAVIELAQAERRAGNLEAAIARLQTLLTVGDITAAHVQAREMLVQSLCAGGRRDEALAVARAAVNDTRRARLLMLVAWAARDADDLSSADAIAREVLALMPDHPQAMELRYEVAARRETVPALVAELQAQVEGDAPEPALRFLARIAGWEDDSVALVAAWERLAELRPDDADVHATLGRMAVEVGDLERAERALRRALEIDPRHGEAARALGEVLVHRGQTDEAVALLRSSGGYDPRDLEAARALGQELSRWSLYHEAVRVYEEARQATGEEHALAWEMARALIAMLEYERTAGELLVALDAGELPPRIIGRELERLATDEIAGPAVLTTMDAHAAGELSDAARIGLGRAYLAVGRREQALELLSGVTGAGSEIAQIARESEFRGETEAAADLYAVALAAGVPSEERGEVARELARLEAARGRWREALSALDAEAAGDDPRALMLRAELLLTHARRPDEAAQALERLATLVDEQAGLSGPLWQMRAECLFRQGRLDEAEAAFLELLADARTPHGGPEPEIFPPSFGTPINQPPAPSGRLAPDDVPPPPPFEQITPRRIPPGFEALPGMAPTITAAPAGEPALAALRLAEITLRRGDRVAAEERLRLVAQAWPDSDEANDALGWLAFLRDNADASEQAWEHYLRALVLLDRGEIDEAEDLLCAVVAIRGEALADDALIVRAETATWAGELTTAVDLYLMVVERCPESLWAPEALLRAARLLRDALGDPARAAEVLRQLVDGYPTSAAARQARSELELLRGVSP